MRTNNRLLLSLLVPLTVFGQSNVWALSVWTETDVPYKKTFQITGKEGGGYSITAVVKPAGVTSMPLSIIQDPEKRKPETAPGNKGGQEGQAANQPGDKPPGEKPPGGNDPNQKPGENTAQQPPVTKQEVEDITKKMAEQLQKQQEELAKQLQKQQEELATQLQKQQEEATKQIAEQQRQANQQLAEQQRQANQQLTEQQRQANQQMANQQQQMANAQAQANAQMQQGMNQLAQQAQQMAQQQMIQQQRQQRQLARLFAQARRDQMMRNFEQAMFGNPNLMNQMNPNTAQGIMGLVSQMMQAASQMAGAMRGGQGQQGDQQNQQAAQGPTAQEIAAELQKLMGDKLSTDAAEKVLAALKETANAPSPQALNEQMQEFTDLGKRLQEAPQSESPSRVSSAADDLSVGPNDYEGLAKLADKLAKGDHRMTKQFLEMSLDAAGRVSSGNSYTSSEKQKARDFALKLVTRFKDLKQQVGSSSASDRSMRSALEFDIDKCMRINNETA